MATKTKKAKATKAKAPKKASNEGAIRKWISEKMTAGYTRFDPIVLAAQFEEQSTLTEEQRIAQVRSIMKELGAKVSAPRSKRVSLEEEAEVIATKADKVEEKKAPKTKAKAPKAKAKGEYDRQAYLKLYNRNTAWAKRWIDAELGKLEHIPTEEEKVALANRMVAALQQQTEFEGVLTAVRAQTLIEERLLLDKNAHGWSSQTEAAEPKRGKIKIKPAPAAAKRVEAPTAAPMPVFPAGVVTQGKATASEVADLLRILAKMIAQ